MKYQFLQNSINYEDLVLPNSDKINPFLLKNHKNEIIKGLDFLSNNLKVLNVHGFMGVGKRQYLNYLCEFLNQEVIKLEYYCKEGTVCDDILLKFDEILENNIVSKTIDLNAKISTLNIKFIKHLSLIKKPIVIILHSFDDILENNVTIIKDFLSKILKEDNIKILISTRALHPSILDDSIEEKKIFLKALTLENFKEILIQNKIEATDTTYEDFYKYTRGYYYYIALSIKIIQAMKISLNEFLQNFNKSEKKFDSYLGETYINIVPTSIRNFFWFLRTLRHGISLNALAIFELYDEFSLEYLKTNLMIFQVDEIVYVQDYFLQKIDILIPNKIEIKLHKYIISLYSEQLKASLNDRIILISRQAMRAEIEYHNSKIQELTNGSTEQNKKISLPKNKAEELPKKEIEIEKDITKQIEIAKNLISDNKNTEAIETFLKIIDKNNIDLITLTDIRLNLARLYKKIENYKMSSYYYELVEVYYKSHSEIINLNYLYYELTDLYYKTYKNERAVNTIKKVIYSVDTPQYLLVISCILLGNIYQDMNNFEEAINYYNKALESLDENISNEILSELYFKLALIYDENNNQKKAFEFYNKCLLITDNNSYLALAYSNLASCYYDNKNYNDAISCYKKAYQIEKTFNNYDGIYYNALAIAKILKEEHSPKALIYLLEASKCAEFLNEDFYILESLLALGDFYYSNKNKLDEALIKYFKAYNISLRVYEEKEVEKIKQRIEDMRLRMDEKQFEEIEKKYGGNY